MHRKNSTLEICSTVLTIAALNKRNDTRNNALYSAKKINHQQGRKFLVCILSLRLGACYYEPCNLCIKFSIAKKLNHNQNNYFW